MKGDKCPRRHEIPEKPLQTSRVCSFFREGKCTFGKTCRMSHAPESTNAENETSLDTHRQTGLVMP